jgi:hypothetical protein
MLFSCGLILVAAFALILGGCQSSQPAANAAPAKSAANSSSVVPSPGPESALPDPCKLLTSAEAESILGEAVRPPEAGSLGGNRICDYKSTAIHRGVLPYSIHIALIGEKKNEWDVGKKMHQESDAKEMQQVNGVADDAYFLLDSLEILSKERYVSVTVLKSIDKPDHMKAVRGAEMAVAQKIVPRLQ